MKKYLLALALFASCGCCCDASCISENPLRIYKDAYDGERFKVYDLMTDLEKLNMLDVFHAHLIEAYLQYRLSNEDGVFVCFRNLDRAIESEYDIPSFQIDHIMIFPDKEWISQ